MSPVRVEQLMTTDINSTITFSFFVEDGQRDWECLKIESNPNGGNFMIISDEDSSFLSGIHGPVKYKYGSRFSLTADKFGPKSMDFILTQGTTKSRIRLIGYEKDEA